MAGGMDNVEGSLNISWERTVAYGNKAEFAEFEVNRIMGEGEALKVEDFMPSE
jgi:hypothetical protein